MKLYCWKLGYTMKIIAMIKPKCTHSMKMRMLRINVVFLNLRIL